jgi:voltage-gated potassium channel
VSLRTRCHRLLEGDQPGDRAGAAIRGFLTLLILLNVVAVVLQTVPGLPDGALGIFPAFETFSVVIFSIEYLLRLWSAPERTPHHPALASRLRWIVSPSALVDLVAVLPSLLPWLGFDLRSVRLLRLLRLARVAKIGRYSLAVHTLHNVLRSKAPDLLSLLGLLLVLLVVSSTIMFHFENEAQPQVFSSIPATMWWGIVTLTTIGYGDMSPVTTAGRAFGGVIAILGIAMFALPAGLLGAAFVDELGKARTARMKQPGGGPNVPEAPGRCPHCGQSLGGPHAPNQNS